MVVVVFLECDQQAVDGCLGACIFGKYTLYEATHSIAHEERVGSDAVSGVTMSLKRMVGGITQILNGVEESSVEVENCQFLHIKSVYNVITKNNPQQSFSV